MTKANIYFRENLLALKSNSFSHPARAKWEDGELANKDSIYQRFELYERGEQPIHSFRECAIKSAIQEIFWIYQDQSKRLEDAHKRGITWWDKFDIGDGTIGFAYGWLVDRFKLIDDCLAGMIKNPFSNRHKIELSDPNSDKIQQSLGGLIACAWLNQFAIIQSGEDRLINQTLNIRSSDYITAGAINRIQYYALGLMIRGHLNHHTKIKHHLNNFGVLTNDLHIYDRHRFAIDELLAQGENIENYSIDLPVDKDFYDYTIDDFVITRPKSIYKLSKPLELAV